MKTLYKLKTFATLLFVVVVFPNLSHAQFVQQGNKLSGTGATTFANEGASVSLSADGNTALVGGNSDNNGAGSVWVYTRTAGVWSQQGTKFTASDSIGHASFGSSVSLAADGNSAVIGGVNNDSGAGAMWVFKRTAGVWSQVGTKFVGTGAIGKAQQGTSVAFSADGNTAVVGGPYDNSGVGAVWIYIQVGTIWSQQGPKLVGTGAVGASNQGRSVAVSSDGNTVIVGGYGDSSYAGAAWVFTRTGRDWFQQGSKLVGTGAVGNADQGQSVSLSSDGNTAIVGGYGDNNFAGAVWVFSRTDTVWSQQGSKLVGTGAVGGFEQQGGSVSLSGDGNTAVIGASSDNGSVGATWAFTRTGSVWSQLGSKFIGTGAAGIAGQGYSVGISRDGSTAIVGGPFDNSAANGNGAVWIFTRSVTSVKEITNGRPTNFALEQNYPNPFNPSTKIHFAVPGSGFVSLKVYDLLGREVATLVNEMLMPGSYETTFDASSIPSGMYFYRMTTGSFTRVNTMMLVK